ncbi:hypothetical protein IM774_03700 [Erysipelotrichaceae bacterium RD49]|nr:hypothetical protein [Erysipelotrichaceae bacterium RD49]
MTTREQVRKLQVLFQQLQESPEGCIKPTFSQVARETGLARQTVAKIWKDPYAQPKERKTRKSQFDEYEDEIRQLFSRFPVSVKAVYRYLQNKYGEENFKSYDSFKYFVRARNLMNDRKPISIALDEPEEAQPAEEAVSVETTDTTEE